MLVGVCGYGNTGASAVNDYLLNYPEVNMFDTFEFQLLHAVDGINDLKYHLVYNKERIGCNAAIQRFRKFCKYGTFGKKMHNLLGVKYDNVCKEYLKRIAKVSWNGAVSAYDPIDISHDMKNPLIWRVKNRVQFEIARVNPSLLIQRYSERFFSFLSEEEFDAITADFLSKLFGMLNIDIHGITMVDMLFSATNPTKGMEFFDDAKAIIVNRDPRDVYVSSKLHKEDSRFMPNDDVCKFVEYYKILNKCVVDNSRVMKVQYEDLIYKYDSVTNSIRSFLGIESCPVNEFAHFNPCHSVRYTNRKALYAKYPDDVSVIERELSAFLYDFDSSVSPLDDLGLRVRCERVEYKGWNVI